MRIASGDQLILNSEVQMFPAGQVQKVSRTVFEMPHTGRKNGFTNVCETCKYVVNLEL